MDFATAPRRPITQTTDHETTVTQERALGHTHRGGTRRGAVEQRGRKGGADIAETPQVDIDAQIEEAVRRYLARTARRYAPLVAGGLAVLLVLALVPTVDRSPAAPAGGVFGPGGGSAGAAPFDGGFAGTGTSTTPSPETSSGPASVTRGTARGTAGSASTSGAQAGAPGHATAAAAPGQAGVARSGVECGPGVRQVPWSAYAPPCVPAFQGDNGGSTSRGVAADTVVISYRKSNSAQDTAVYSAAGNAAPAPDPVFLADMAAYIDLFNSTFELYGRKVVLKDYQGQGDYISEDMGQGQDAAQADAATAYDLGAFADLTFFLKGSQPYWTALAQKKIVAIGPLGFPDTWFQRNSPYWYSVQPTGSKVAEAMVNYSCRRMAGLPAIFAGDDAMHGKKRVFGLVTPENPEYMEIGDAIERGFGSCGEKVAKRVSYSINVAAFQAQSTNMVAQFNAADVTTVLCFCDPLVPIFLSQSADQQRFRPEWFVTYYGDPQSRQTSQQQWAHAMTPAGTWPAQGASEAYQAFKLARPDAEPAEKYFDVAYAHLLLLFAGLQAAGPDLTPQTFQQGLWSLPASEDGVYGTWSYGADTWSPGVNTGMAWWDPDATSNFDDGVGAWQSCEGGARFPYARPEAWGASGRQPACFGA